MKLFKYNYSIFLFPQLYFYYIFSSSRMISQNLQSCFFFFLNEKLFGGFSKWPILVTANLHLLLSKAKLGNSQKLFSLTVPPFNTLMPGGNKSSYIININSSFQSQFFLSLFNLLLPSGIKRLKYVQSVLLLIKKIITVVVRNLSFALEIPYSELDKKNFS